MAANSINVVTIDIQNPAFYDQQRTEWFQLPSNLSYQLDIKNNIRTLSSRGASADDNIFGLLYLPSLSASQAHACPQASNTTLIPKNTTGQNDLPGGYPLIGLAPWVSADCATAFLAAADPEMTLAMIMYLPDVKRNGNATAQPPPADSDVWKVNDDAWTHNYPFPVYAVPTAIGAEWMRELAAYSGNITQVPNGRTLDGFSAIGSTDYIRLEAIIRTGGGSNLPSLWVFLLIILAVVFLVVGTVSSCMHCVARKRRAILRRRIAEGDVDLEALGIKRLTIPKEVLDKMPLYTYTTGPTSPPAAAAVAASTKNVATLEVTPIPTSPTEPHVHSHTKQQTTCAICLDDFIAANSTPESKPPPTNPDPPTNSKTPPSITAVSTSSSNPPTRPSSPTDEAAGEPSVVRELPCGHIFHADCVDPFLTAHSSLCPLCKKSSLPKGYVPRTITNIMVRRERQMRQQSRQRASVSGGGGRPAPRTRDVLRNVLRGRRESPSVGFSERVVEQVDSWREARIRSERELFSRGPTGVPLGRIGIAAAATSSRRGGAAPAATSRATVPLATLSPSGNVATDEEPVRASGALAAGEPATETTGTTAVTDRAPPALIVPVRPGSPPLAVQHVSLDAVVADEEQEQNLTGASSSEPGPRKSWWRNAAGRIFPRA